MALPNFRLAAHPLRRGAFGPWLGMGRWDDLSKVSPLRADESASVEITRVAPARREIIAKVLPYPRRKVRSVE